MDVNYDVWGAPEEWRDLSSFTFSYLADFKCPKNGVNSYSDLYRNDVLQGGVVPTDLSIAFWGINKKSILAHPVYLSSYWDGDEIKTAVNRVTDKAETVPCILNYSDDPGLSVNTNWYYRYAPIDNPGEAEWYKNSIVYNTRYKREIAISFNYQKIMLIPWIRIALENPSSNWGYQVVKLKDYIDNRFTTYANYNKIVGIGYRIAIGDTNRNRDETGMGFVIPSSYEASEREYVDNRTYKWFATKYGYYTLSTNGVIGYNDTRSIAPYNTDESSVSPVDFSSLHLIGDADTGFRYKYCKNYGSNYGQVPIYYYDTDEPLWKVNAYTPWNTNYAHPFPYIECTTDNIDAVRDYVLTQIAYLGFPFVYDYEKARYGQIGDEGVYLPVFDNNGVTTGAYREGAPALALPNAEWIDAREGSGYDPFKPPPSIKPVKQRPYITVYSYRTPQDGFDNHGLYILTPTRCTIVEALNGRYELSIEHPIDLEGRWEYIRENNIIKALGQLFTIRSVTQKWQGRSGKITAKADHIFYQLSDWWIERGNEDIAARTVTGLISLAVSKTVKHLSPGQTAYTYHYDSDMTVPDVLGDNKWEWLKEGMTPIDFVMGSNGVLEACGGRLHRDNFRFSIYERKEGSKDNAFEIRVGKNLTGISRTIDASSLITYLKAWDNYGNWFAVSWVGSEDIGMPHYTVREKEFSYSLKDLYYRDESAVAAQMLAQDALDYFNATCAPLISYDIDLVDIKNNPEYEDLQLADEFKVGNRGYIYDERIGGKVLIEITETTTNAMTGEVTNVLFGSKRNFMNAWNRTAIIDIEVEPEEIGFVVTDAEGAFVYDSEGARIVEYEGV